MLSRFPIKTNPVMVKELRSRMRGSRAFTTLTVVLILQGGISYLFYWLMAQTSPYSRISLSSEIGQTLYITLFMLVLFMVCAITPAVTAGAIAEENEKLTLEMLMATPLHPASILWGKLLSALGYVFLLIFASIPIASLIFLFGGISLKGIIKSLVVLVIVALTIGVIGLFMSAWLKRTSRATVLTYLIVVLLIAGTLFAYFVSGIFSQSQEPPRWMLILNPISILSSAMTSSIPPTGSPLDILRFLGAENGFFGPVFSQTSIPRPIYHYGVAAYGAISILFFFLGSRFVSPVRRWQISKKERLALLIVIFSYIIVVGGAYAATAGRYERAVNPIETPEPVFIEPAIRLPPPLID